MSEQRAAEEKRRASPPVGHPPEVTDAGKAFWQHMHQEPAQELLVGKSHGAVLALVGVVFPAKSYAVVVDAKQTVVGNGDSMGVTGQVLQNVFVLTTTARLLRNKYEYDGLGHQRPVVRDCFAVSHWGKND